MDVDSSYSPEPLGAKTEIDFTYLEKWGSREKYQIPSPFERLHFKEGQFFQAKITQIYDISKFWLVSKYRELELFEKYIFRFYYMNQSDYRVPKEKLSVEMYCVCFVDSAYYRGVILGFPITNIEQRAQVLFIDHGMIKMVKFEKIFYMSQQLLNQTRFAIRAGFPGVLCPAGGKTWSSEDVAAFSKIVLGEIVRINVDTVDEKREVLEVTMGVKNEHNVTVPVHEMLISMNVAKCSSWQKGTGDKIRHYAHLYPSHEAIESGKIPSLVTVVEYLMQIAASNPVQMVYENRDDVFGRQVLDEAQTAVNGEKDPNEPGKAKKSKKESRNLESGKFDLVIPGMED